MTQEENLDTSHQANNPVYDQVSDDTHGDSKNMVANCGERNSSSSSAETTVTESNKSAIRESSLEGKIPVPDRDRDLQGSLSVGNAKDHKINNSNFIDMTVITQQNSNDNLRDIQSNINKGNATNNVKTISARATSDNSCFHSEKAINSDPESDGANSGKSPKNENSSCIQTTGKNNENDSVKLVEANNVQNNYVQQKGNLDKHQKQQLANNVDPVARLNALRANISNALKEVKAVLDQHAPPPELTAENGAKREDDSCIKFRFVRRIRRKSVINLDDEEIICNVPSNVHDDNTKVLSQSSITSDGVSTLNQQTEKPHLHEKNTHASQSESPETAKSSDSKEKPSEGHAEKLKGANNTPKDLQSTSSDTQKKDVERKDKRNHEYTEKPKNDSTKLKEENQKNDFQHKDKSANDSTDKLKNDSSKLKDVKIRRKIVLQKAASIDNDGSTKINEATIVKRGSLTETKTTLPTVTKLKRASICEGDLGRLAKQVTDKKLTKIQPKMADSVRVKCTVKKTTSKDNINTDTKLNKIIAPSQSGNISVTNTAKDDAALKATQIKSAPASLKGSASQDNKSHPEDVSKTNSKDTISQPVMQSNANKKAPNEIITLISSVEKNVSSESNKEKPIMSVTRVPVNDAIRPTATKDPSIYDKKDKSVQSTGQQSQDNRRHSKDEVGSKPNISVISSPTSLLGSQQIPKTDKIESSIPHSKSPKNLSIVSSSESIPLKEGPHNRSSTMEIAEEAGLLQRHRLLRMEATNDDRCNSLSQKRPNAEIKENIVSQVQTLEGLKEPIQVSSDDQKLNNASAKSPSLSVIPKIQTKNIINKKTGPLSPAKEEKEIKLDQDIPPAPTSCEVVNSSNLTSKQPQISTSIASSTPEVNTNHSAEAASQPEAALSESIESKENAVADSSATHSKTAETEDCKLALSKKRKIKKKVIIRRIKRRLSRDNSLDEKVEHEICEKPIEPDIDEVEQIAPVEETPSRPKSCLKVRAYELGDVVMYADRVRKSVKWKKATVVSKITSISYTLDIDGEEKPAHISYIKKFTNKKVQFGGKEYLEIDYEQENEEPEEEVYNIWARV